MSNDLKTKQLQMWLSRVRSNIEGFKVYHKEYDKDAQLKVIRHQYALIDGLKGILKGSSYLEGINILDFEKQEKLKE